MNKIASYFLGDQHKIILFQLLPVAGFRGSYKASHLGGYHKGDAKTDGLRQLGHEPGYRIKVEEEEHTHKIK
jgi:hypothetical protein